MIWRDPPEESIDLYPGLVVHDGRISGSITIGRRRLALWYFIGRLSQDGWENATRDYDVGSTGWQAEDMDHLLRLLFDLRGEFARLLLILADVERIGGEREDAALEAADVGGTGLVKIALFPGDEGAQLPDPWWKQVDLRERVVVQLRRCLAALDAET